MKRMATNTVKLKLTISIIFLNVNLICLNVNKLKIEIIRLNKKQIQLYIVYKKRT